MALVIAPDAALVLEWVAVVLNIVFTILIGLHRRGGWLFGLVAAVIGVLLYTVQDAWLMALLNAFYAAMGAYGWWTWGRDSGTQRIVRHTWRRHAMLLALGVGATALLWWVMETTALPGRYHGMEAFIAAFAMLATWLMSERALENWIYWTIGDVVAVAYNHWLGYDGYALLNGIYVALAIVGYIRWQRQWRTQHAIV